MSKEVVVRQLPAKKNKAVVIETPEEPQQVQTINAPSKIDFAGAMSVLKELGFKVSPPEIETDKKKHKKSAKVKVEYSESESEEEEEPVVIKSKKKVEKKIPKKREEKEEEEEDEYIELPAVKMMNAKQAQTQVKQSQSVPQVQPQQVVAKPQPVQIGLGSNPLARRYTPFGLPL